MMHQAYIGLGANLGDRFQQCQQAIDLLRTHAVVTAVAPCYETDPIPGTEGGAFLNGVLKIATDKAPEPLLLLLQEVEIQLGRERAMRRKRAIRWGARTMDLDLLFFDEKVIRTRNLVVPHPELEKRRFVLQPLADLAPDLLHPTLQKTVKQLLVECSDPGQVVYFGKFT